MTTTATLKIDIETLLAPDACPERHDHQAVSVVAPGAPAGRADSPDATSADDARVQALEARRLDRLRADAERRLQNVRGASPFRGAM